MRRACGAEGAVRDDSGNLLPGNLQRAAHGRRIDTMTVARGADGGAAGVAAAVRQRERVGGPRRAQLRRHPRAGRGGSTAAARRLRAPRVVGGG